MDRQIKKNWTISLNVSRIYFDFAKGLKKIETWSHIDRGFIRIELSDWEELKSQFERFSDSFRLRARIEKGWKLVSDWFPIYLVWAQRIKNLSGWTLDTFEFAARIEKD